MSFIDGIKERAKKDLKTIVLPEAEDERTIRAAAEILSKKLAKLILLGNPDQIYADAKEYGVHVSDAVIVDPQNCGEKLDEYANLLYELRKNKGMTPEKARETILKDYTTFGVLMVKNNEADGLVSGACHSTANTLLHSGRTELRVRTSRNVYLRGFRTESGSNLRAAGRHCQCFLQELSAAGCR